MMMGFGILFMLAVLALPILLIVGLVVWMMRTNRRPNTPPVYRPPAAIPPQRVVPPAPAQTSSATRACSHCGAGLQLDWSHCPQCGAPAA